MRRHFIEAPGVRLRRSTCGRCGEPVEWLGEAIRVDLAEGGRFQVVHSCWPCLRRARLRAISGKEVLAA